MICSDQLWTFSPEEKGLVSVSSSHLLFQKRDFKDCSSVRSMSDFHSSKEQQFSWSDSLRFHSPTLLGPSCSRVEFLALENKYFSMYICYYRDYCENLKELILSHLKNLIKNYWMNPFGYCGTKESSFQYNYSIF